MVRRVLPLTADCPDCSAAPGEPCRYTLTQIGKEMTGFHLSRVDRSDEAGMSTLPVTDIRHCQLFGFERCDVCGLKPEPCPQCGDEHHDPCIGHIGSATQACCGHGTWTMYVAFPAGEMFYSDAYPVIRKHQRQVGKFAYVGEPSADMVEWWHERRQRRLDRFEQHRQTPWAVRVWRRLRHLPSWVWYVLSGQDLPVVKPLSSAPADGAWQEDE